MAWSLQNDKLHDKSFRSPWITPKNSLMDGSCRFCGNVLPQAARYCPHCYALINHASCMLNRAYNQSDATIMASTLASSALYPFPLNMASFGLLSALSFWRPKKILDTWLHDKTFTQDNEIQSCITLELAPTQTIDLNHYFSILATSAQPITLDITGGQLDFTDTALPPSIDQLTLSRVKILHLPESMWRVSSKIALSHIDGLRCLPEILGPYPNYQTLDLYIDDCPITHLPKTLCRRKIKSLSVLNCPQVTTLPCGIKKLIDNGTLRSLSLRGSGIALYNDSDVNLSRIVHADIFCNHDMYVAAKPDKRMAYLTKTFIPLGLIYVVMDHLLGRSKIRPFFWLSFASMGLISASILSPSIKELPKTVCDLIAKRGVEDINGFAYDWDALWESIFTCGAPPAELETFIHAINKLLVCKGFDAIEKALWRIVASHGGYNFLADLSKRPLACQLSLIEEKAACEPSINDLISTIRGSFTGRTIHVADFTTQPSMSFWPLMCELLACAHCPRLDIKGNSKTHIQLKDCGFFQSICIKDAILGSVSPTIWDVKESLHLENVDLSLPRVGVKKDLPPLELTLIQTSISSLPNDLRPLAHLTLIDNKKLNALPQSLKKTCPQSAYLSGNGFKTRMQDYENPSCLCAENIFDKPRINAAGGIALAAGMAGVALYAWTKTCSRVKDPEPLLAHKKDLRMVLSQIVSTMEVLDLLTELFYTLNHAQYITPNAEKISIDACQIIHMVMNGGAQVYWKDDTLYIQAENGVVSVPDCHEKMFNLAKDCAFTRYLKDQAVITIPKRYRVEVSALMDCLGYKHLGGGYFQK